MRVNVKTGILDGVMQIPSPNHDKRPEGNEIELLVIHGISLPPGEFGGPFIEQLFTNTLEPSAHPYFKAVSGLKVSSHLLIRRTGEIVQFASFNQRAWHAGESCYQGKENCNDFSLGIELEGTDDLPYADRQYNSLNQVLTALMYAYPGIARERIIGHCDIAPGRKTDPGASFDWQRIYC